MILTERDANAKRCPMPMGTMHDARVQNHCIASECMAWDWEDDEFEYYGVDLTPTGIAAPEVSDFKRPEGDGWETPGPPFQPLGYGRQWRLYFRRPWGERRRGFCGLARRADVRVEVPQP